MTLKPVFNRWQRYALSVLSGVLITLSFPYTGSMYPLVFIAWIPLLLVEHQLYEAKKKSGNVFWQAYIAFLIYNVGASFWIYYSIGGESAAILAYFLNGLIMALVFFAFHRLKRSFGPKIGQFSLLIFWVGFEFIHFNWELSWPWLNFGNVFADAVQYIQWYSFTGILGGTCWILVVNTLFFLSIKDIIFHKKRIKKQRIYALSGFLFILIPAVVSLIVYKNYKEPKNPIQIVVTQPNIDPYNVKFSTPIISQLKQFVLPAEKLITDSTAIVLAPETAIPAPFLEKQYAQSAGMRYLNEHLSTWGHTSLLVGAATQRVFDHHNSVASRAIPGTDNYFENYNSAVLMQQDTPPLFVHKSKLVLGVEKIPFTKWFPFLEELSVQNGGTSGTLGVEKTPKVLSTNGFTFAPVVCYGSIYGDFVGTQCRKGAQVIFVITNDGWWGNSPGYKQHFSFARLRAIETRRYVAQSANTGISCVINERGDVVKATDYWVKDAFRSTVQLNNEKTFYVLHGDWIGNIAFFLFLVAVFTLLLKPIFLRILKRTNSQA